MAIQKRYLVLVNGSQRAIQNIILGRVAVKLLQSLAFVPIILVGQAPPVKKVLLAVDPSPNSMKAVEFVGFLLGGHSCEICIFLAIIGLGKVHFELSGGEIPKASEAQADDTCIEAFKLKIAQLFWDIREKLVSAGVKPECISEKNSCRCVGSVPYYFETGKKY